MIAGNTNLPFSAASHIMDRIEKSSTNLAFYVWLQDDKVHYCSESSQTLIPESKLVGTYVRRRSLVNNITAMQICEDIEACKEPMV